MLRPHSHLYNIATDTPAAGGGISHMVMKHIASADATVANLPGVTKTLADGVAKAAEKTGGDGEGESGGEGQGDDDADPTKGGDKKPSDEPKPKADAEGAGSDDDEGEDDPIKPEDDVKVQLEKLRKAQARTLKRIDKVTAQRNELEAKLAKHEPQADDAPAAGDSLGHVKTADDLDATVKQIDGYLTHLSQNAAKGTTIKGPGGQDIELSPEDVVKEILYWTDVKANQVPSKRAFLADRAKAQTEAADRFKPWLDKKIFTDAKAEVEKGMKGTKALMADYDLAVHERTLGRLAISGDYDLVPKRKTPVGGVESAPAKPKAPATPVVPPNSGGPPIKPAGAGPDLEQLKQNMLKNPGNAAAVQAFVKAQLAAGKQS